MADSTFTLTVTGFSSTERVSVTSSGTGIFEVRESIATGVTDGVLALSSDVSSIEFLYILSTRALTLKTYDATSTLVDTISLAANTPVVYKKSPAIGENPFSGDFVSAAVTNASGSTASLTILMLSDATP